MGKFYEKLNPAHREFIAGQKIYFVATSPKEGRINLSPKGMGGFAVLSEEEVAFANLVGSGNETAAHLLEDGRITLMFCSFEDEPQILKLYGHGQSIHPGEKGYEDLLAKVGQMEGIRQIIRVRLNSVQTSCGYGVPFFEYQGERPTMAEWIANKGPEGVQNYQDKNNRISIDGQPTGLP